MIVPLKASAAAREQQRSAAPEGKESGGGSGGCDGPSRAEPHARRARAGACAGGRCGGCSALRACVHVWARARRAELVPNAGASAPRGFPIMPDSGFPRATHPTTRAPTCVVHSARSGGGLRHTRQRRRMQWAPRRARCIVPHPVRCGCDRCRCRLPCAPAGVRARAALCAPQSFATSGGAPVSLPRYCW